MWFVLVVFTLAGTVAAQQALTPLKTEQDYAKAMRELRALDSSLRNNIEEVARADLERVLLFETTMKARDEAVRIEEILAGVLAFWEAKKTTDAIALSKSALVEAANISKALEIIDLHSPSVATLAQERLNKICTTCHAAHREKQPDGTFKIK